MVTHNRNQNSVVVVSGLPRSGTSLMMQLLAAGGMPVLTDGVRKADEDNRYGFFEFEAVKRIKSDASWIAGATGKVVKMVYRLLYDLPLNRHYRIIFMQRRMEEVLASQRAMLRRQGKQAGADDETLTRIFRNELAKVQQWLRARSNFSVLQVDYNQLVIEPWAKSADISAFLGGGLNIEAMTDTVDPMQYRNRIEEALVACGSC